MLLSIAVPAYNEGQHLDSTVRGWVDYLKARNSAWSGYEIVLCNDGSKDHSKQVLDQLAREFKEVRPVHHATNFGAAAALRTAIQHTSGDWVFLIDADGQFPISNLEVFEKAIRDQPAPAYIGVRPEKKDVLFARFGSWASGLICRWIYKQKFLDFNSALKLVEGRLLRSLNLEARGLNYSTEISGKILERGTSMIEVPIRHNPRTAGKSSRKMIRDSWHRFLMVSYLGFRMLLLRQKVILLDQPTLCEADPKPTPRISDDPNPKELLC